MLRQVASVVRENSRDTDSPARCGGEELSLILLHPHREGARAIAERTRAAAEKLSVPRTDGRGVPRITASVGVAASTAGHQEVLIADGDAALYDAKRRGRNCTVSAGTRTSNAAVAGYA